MTFTPMRLIRFIYWGLVFIIVAAWAGIVAVPLVFFDLLFRKKGTEIAGKFTIELVFWVLDKTEEL